VNSRGVDSVPPVFFGVESPVSFLKENIGKEIVLPIPGCESPEIAVPVRLTLGTPLLPWYLRLKDEGTA
jgi:hypothetical protein